MDHATLQRGKLCVSKIDSTIPFSSGILLSMNNTDDLNTSLLDTMLPDRIAMTLVDDPES